MRKTIRALVLLTILGLGEAGAENKPHNFCQNAGFEESFALNIDKWFKSLREAGVELPAGDIMDAPKGVRLLGRWEQTPGCRFQYIRGKPGQEVHGGEYAIQVVSPQEVALQVGAGWPASDNPDHERGKELSLVFATENPDNDAIGRGKTYVFSFFAKGTGTVRIALFPFNKESSLMDGKTDPSGETLCLVNEDQDPKAATFDVDNELAWQCYEGTIRIIAKSVRAIRLVLWFKGDISLDDISLTAAKAGDSQDRK